MTFSLNFICYVPHYICVEDTRPLYERLLFAVNATWWGLLLFFCSFVGGGTDPCGTYTHNLPSICLCRSTINTRSVAADLYMCMLCGDERITTHHLTAVQEGGPGHLYLSVLYNHPPTSIHPQSLWVPQQYFCRANTFGHNAARW